MEGNNDMKSGIDAHATKEIQYFFLLEKKVDPIPPFIMIVRDNQKIKYSGNTNVFNGSVEYVNDDDYITIPILEEEAKSMYNFQMKVETFLQQYYKDITDINKKIIDNLKPYMGENENLKLNKGENDNLKLNKGENDNLKLNKGETTDKTDKLNHSHSALPNDIHDKLVKMIKNISTSEEDVMKKIDDCSFIPISTLHLKMFNDRQKSGILEEDNELKLLLDNVKKMDTLSRQYKPFLTLIKDDDGLTKTLYDIFEILTNKDKLSPAEEKLLTLVLSVYWKILKSGGKTNIPKSQYLEKCFNHHKADSPIKIGASLCLSYIIESSCSLYVELYTYLKKVQYGPTNVDIFSQEDILTGLGKMSMDVDHANIFKGQLMEQLQDIYKLTDIDTNKEVPEEVHDYLEFLYTALAKLSKESAKVFENDRFIIVSERILKMYLDTEQTIENHNKILLPTLRILRQLTLSNSYFIKKLIDNKNLLSSLVKIFAQATNFAAQSECLSNILLIYWNLYKSGVQFSHAPKLGQMELFFKRSVGFNIIKCAASLCLTVMINEMSETFMEVKKYLSGINNLGGSSELSQDDVHIGLGIISLRILKDSNKLSNVCENVSKSEADVKKEVSNASFISFTIQHLSKYNSNQQRVVKVVNESEFTLDDSKIISTLSRQHKFRIKSIKEEDDLTKELNMSIEILTKKDQLSPKEEKVLTKILSTYWQILKTDCLTNIPKSEYLEKCFSLHKGDSSIKIGASMCLSCLIDSSSSLYGEVCAYLSEKHPKKFDTFSQDEIWMGLGIISKKKVTDKVLTGTSDHINTMSSPIDHACYASIDSKNMSMTNLEELQSSFMESNHRESVGKELITIEDYERCLRVVTGNMKTLAYEDSINCIRIALDMNDKRIITNLISSSGPIDFEKDNAVCARIIGMYDEDVVLSLLNNCVTTVNDNGMLLGVAKRLGDGVASLVGKKIAGNKVTGVANKNCLNMAFCYLGKRNLELFKDYVGACSDVNDYLDEKNTFLTKILRELDNDLIGEAIKVCQFDVNKCDKGGVSSICIACEKEDEIMVDHVISISREIEDWRNARKIASNISNKDVSNSILKKLCSLP